MHDAASSRRVCRQVSFFLFILTLTAAFPSPDSENTQPDQLWNSLARVRRRMAMDGDSG